MFYYAFGFVVMAAFLIEWWMRKGKEETQKELRGLQTMFAKLFGYVVVDHTIEWYGLKITERFYFLPRTTDEVIEKHNTAWMIGKSKKHKLEGKGAVWYWEYA